MTIGVKLRNLTEEDLPVLFNHQIDPAANAMAAFPARSWGEFMNHWKSKILADASSRKKTIVVDEEIAGYVTSWQQGGKQLVGYWVGKEHWGKGVATKALSEFLILFPERPLHAFVAKHNIGSIRVLEKCGFQMVGAEFLEAETDRRSGEECLMKLG